MKIGFDQTGIPAPLILRRAIKGFASIVQPATMTFILAIPEDKMSKDGKIILAAIVAYSGAFLGWLEFIIGTDPTDIAKTKVELNADLQTIKEIKNP